MNDRKRYFQQFSSPRSLALISVCIALNAGVGFLVQLLKLPVFLDMIGSLLAVAILGLLPGILVAALGIVILGVVATPTAFAYIGTAVIATAAGWWFLRFGYIKRLVPTIIFGILLGLLSAILSAPITTFLFGGITFAGTDAATAFFSAFGKNLYHSVLLGGLSTDPVDKLLVSLACYGIYRTLPASMRKLAQERG